MPTAYTDAITEDMTLEAFAFRCARAMGALVMMREDPLDAPIVEFKPSDFHAKAMEDAKARLAKLQAMTPADVEAERLALASEAQAMAEKLRADSDANRRKYERMLRLVEGWIPPTAEHEGLRSFMIQQLRESIDFDCWDEDAIQRIIPRPKESARDWLEAEIKKAHEDVGRHAGEYAKEVARTEGRNAWVKALRQSLGGQ